MSNFKSNVTPPVVHVNDVDILIDTQQLGYLDIVLELNNSNFKTSKTKVLSKVEVETAVKAETFTINWGDGTAETYTYETDTKIVEHTYVIDGEYTIKITDDYTGIISNQAKQVIINDNNNINKLSVSTVNLDSNNGIVNLDKLYPTLESLYIANNTFLSDNLEETLLKFPKLTTLNIINKGLTSFNTQGFEKLQFFHIANNPITSLDVSKLVNLENLALSFTQILNNELKTLLTQIPNKDKLKVLSCNGLGITDTFDVTDFTNLEILACRNNGDLSSLVISNLTKLNFITLLGSIGITSLNCSNTALDNIIGLSGLTNLTTFNCSNTKFGTLDVTGLTNLTTLNCSNTKLATLNLSTLTNLTTLTVSGVTTLTSLNCSNTKLTTLNVTGLTNLTFLDCSNTKLTTLDVSTLTNLTTLDVTAITTLTTLNCSNTKLTTLDVSTLTNLTTLNVTGLTNLTTLNVTGLTNLTTLNCSNTTLAILYVLGATNLTTLNCNSCNFNQVTANALAGQLVANGKNNGTLNLSTQQSGTPIVITGSLLQLQNPPKNWTITV